MTTTTTRTVDPLFAAQVSELLIRRIAWSEAAAEIHPDNAKKAKEVAAAFSLVYRTLRSIALDASIDPDALELPLPRELNALFQQSTDRALSTQEI